MRKGHRCLEIICSSRIRGVNLVLIIILGCFVQYFYSQGCYLPRPKYKRAGDQWQLFFF